MSLLALPASFEYLCHWSMAINDIYRRLSPKVNPCSVNFSQHLVNGLCLLGGLIVKMFELFVEHG